MQNPIYKVIESDNKKLTENAKKCDECDNRCTEYHAGWICVDNEE